jgi:hypothetical protein
VGKWAETSFFAEKCLKNPEKGPILALFGQF